MALQIKKGRALDSLSLTPLIDVVFLLLIFFLVATRFAQDDRELPVLLPSAASAVPMTAEPAELVVNVDTAGRYMVGGERLSLDQVESVLRRSIADNPINLMVIIRADRNVVFQAVVSVMDLCNKLKVASYKISTEAESGS
jgi:biopolymer transport protein ExbD